MFDNGTQFASQQNSPRFQSFVVEESTEGMEANLDLLDKMGEHARINSGFKEGWN